MRYIDKSKRCIEFDDYVSKCLSLSKDFDFDEPSIKLKLHQHLRYEQGGLCIYCQQTLQLKQRTESNAHRRSHIEHIRPRASYPYLTFVYCNLSVCCEGFDCDIPPTNKQPKQEFCEHRKGKEKEEYNEEYFLNPVELKNIESYFIYKSNVDKKSVLLIKILPKHKEGTKEHKQASHMIKILALNHDKLQQKRGRVVTTKRKEKKLGKGTQFKKNEKILPQFYSMLLQLKLL
ncbi:MAG: TIGR02646 family protein [Bacteroidales bacterium]|nr:TIGR02646 family protein [Bacteroidales bacterium]